MQKLWKKQENRKGKEEKERKIYKWTPGTRFGPAKKRSPRPSSKPKRYLLFFSYIANVWALRVSTDTIFHLGPDFSPETVSSPPLLPLLKPL
jgi:hypothetical protein